MEIEAKFDWPEPQVEPGFTSVEQIAGYPLMPPRSQYLHDIYLDTPDGAIQARGFACRRRVIDGLIKIQLKALAPQTGLIHRREELEIILPEDRPLENWPESQVKALVKSACAGKRPTPLFSVFQERQIREVLSKGRSVANLSLDNVTITAGARLSRFSEIEIELSPGGSEEDLRKLAGRMREVWGLAPAGQTKFERGLTILQNGDPQSDRPGLELSALPKFPVLAPQASMASAAREILAIQFRHMLANEAGTILGDDIEALHDMRVATRRMRAALRVFEEFLDQKTIRPIMKGLRRTGRSLGEVRDLDVFWEKAQVYLKSLPNERQDELESLEHIWQRQREVSRERMRGYLEGQRYNRFKMRFEALLQEPAVWAPVHFGEDGQPNPHQIRHILPRVVSQRLEEMLAYDEWIQGPDVPLDRYHNLRIAAKRLRYTLEFFQGTLDPAVKAVIDRVKSLQDHLGDLQDATVAIETLERYLTSGLWGRESPDLTSADQEVEAAGVRQYLAAKKEEQRRLIDTFPATWVGFYHPDFLLTITGLLVLAP